MIRSLRLAAPTLSLLALAACSSSHMTIGDAGPVPDGLIVPDANLMMTSCGAELCGAGETCCAGCPGDPPLGCYPSGSACPSILCPPVWTSCTQALHEGSNGDLCNFADSCSEALEGDCCSRLASCAPDGTLRIETTCAPGCFACATNEDCAPDQYCDSTSFGCGGPGSCMPRPTACDDDCPGVCGCNGETYCNACTANTAGVSVARSGACDGPSCDAQDARGSGACALFLGYTWNGEGCTGIGGCSCEGVDCDSLYESPDACEAAHAMCTAGSSCDPMNARGDGLCDGFFGYSWNGMSCTGITGCSCEGSDCDRLYRSPASCEAAHAACGAERCSEQQAFGVGDCRRFLGYRWTGARCEGISGCECSGEDCDGLYMDEAACRSAHDVCVDG